MDLYNQVVEFVDNAYQGKATKHFERAVYWFEQFLDEPITEMQKIAAYSHDIERAFRKPSSSNINYTDDSFLKHHQTEGARIMAEFLKERGVSDSDMEIVKHIIEKHEEGGDKIQNAMMDADSVSFFETNAERFATEKIKTEGYESIKDKLDWMYNRISSEKAKEIAEPLYQKWSTVIEQWKKSN